MGRDLETIYEVPEAFHAADFRVDRARRGRSPNFMLKVAFSESTL